jgi:hypothetical protein
MLECRSCGATNAGTVRFCAKCGTSLAGAGVAPALQDARDEDVISDLARRDRLRRRRLSHAFAGAATFFGVLTLFGLPGSLMPTALLTHALVGAVIGSPIGWLISRLNAGPIQGALLSAGTLFLVRAVTGWIGGEGSSVWLGAFVAGLGGLVPGALIGYHVELDS